MNSQIFQNNNINNNKLLDQNASQNVFLKLQNNANHNTLPSSNPFAKNNNVNQPASANPQILTNQMNITNPEIKLIPS